MVIAWDSLLIQVRGFYYALDSRQLLGMALSSVQAFILMLQMLGISYLLCTLGHRLLGFVVWTTNRKFLQKV